MHVLFRGVRLGREIVVATVNSPSDLADASIDRALVLFWNDGDDEFARGVVEFAAERQALGLFLAGNQSELLFDEGLEILSKRPSSPHVMTGRAHESGFDAALEEFLTGFFPAEERFAAWTSSLVVFRRQDTFESIRSALMRLVDSQYLAPEVGQSAAAATRQP